jgi:hypothetical protein
MSGLGRVKRDFSSPGIATTQSSNSSSSRESADQTKKLSGNALRLKLIQDALAENAAAERVLVKSATPNVALKPGGLVDAGGPKRSAESDIAEPPAKRRALPPTWDQPASSPKLATSSITNNSSSIVKIATTAPSASGPSKKMASIFLSQEQTQILNLVNSGQSVFYTGSAGESCFSLDACAYAW